jgi:periplasmic copper chaperone A
MAYRQAGLLFLFRITMSHTFSSATQFIALCAISITATAAFSHVTLEQQQVETGTYYKATLRVGHGCEGLPTTAIRVQLPAGFQGAKPMPKAGWSVQTTLAKLATPYDNHGKPVTEDVTEIVWTANSPASALPDNQYDEFALRGRAAMPVGAAWFKVTQLCKDGAKEGSNPWTEIPAQGTSTRGMKFPAALLNVTAPVAVPSTPSTSTVPAAPAVGTVHKH